MPTTERRYPDWRSALVSSPWIVVGGLTLIAFLARVWQLNDAGLSYTDEGTYALSAYGLTHPGEGLRWFPNIERYSPPLFVLVVASAFALFGPADTNAILVNVVVGTLTVPLVWWVARRWSGHGVLAAALVAVSPMHVLLSRTAMTDVLFAGLFVLSLELLRRSGDRPGVRATVVAGLVLAATCATKYHGPLALVIATIPFIARRNWRALRRMVAAGAIAALAMVPWLAFVALQPGGIYGWLHHYAGFMTHSWTTVARIQVANLWHLSAATPLLAALAALGLWLHKDMSGRRVLIAWTLTWLVLAPTYDPYFRLLLPLVIALSIGGAAGWHAIHDRGGWRVSGAVLAGLMGLTLWTHAAIWRPTDANRQAAVHFSSFMPPGEPVLMMGNNQLAFYFVLLGHRRVEAPMPVAALDTVTAPRYVAWGPRERIGGELRTDWPARAISRWRVQPSELQLLDSRPPRAAQAYRARPDTTFDLVLGITPSRVGRR